jgi:molecular chaperone GrpE
MQEPETRPAVDPTGPGSQAANESPAALGSATVADVERELQAALDEARNKAAEYQDLYLRSRAEAENTRRRAQEDIAKASKFAVESLAREMLPVLDSLEKALETAASSPQALRDGVDITLRQLRAAFERSRMTEFNPQGERFDPHRHQAISMVPAEGVPPNHVVAVLQKGWMLADRVLRPALVTVSQA